MMEAATRKKLQKYINLQPSSPIEMAAAVVNPHLYFRIAARAISSLFRTNHPPALQGHSIPKSIDIYKGENPFVLEMMDFLLMHLQGELAGAYVHGSLGTSEEIAYSDFDALVILKDSVVSDPAKLAKVASRLHRARYIMQRFDPLQHHGWFVLTESDLQHYPQTYFPHQLFDNAKSLLTDQGLHLKLYLNKEADYITPLKNLAGSIINKLEKRDYPQTMYQLKGLTSEFMLLPALYVQAETGNGIYKRESFSEAKKDFTKDEWFIMDEVSRIRKDWHYEMSKKERKEMMSLNPLMVRRKKQSGPGIPPDLSARLSSEFYDNLKSFCYLMLKKMP
ncbi:MAG: hypothetical protein WD077_12265 [Bacteroidia bacterium]